MSENKGATILINKLKWLNNTSKLIFLTIIGQWSFYGIFRCPFPVPFVGCSNCPVITCWGRISSLFWGFWLVLPLSVILFGRAFCGWACPGGFINQMFGKISPFKTGPKSRLNKFAPLGFIVGISITLYLWLGWNNPRLAIPIRVGEFWQSIALTFEHADSYWLARTAIVLSLTLASFLVVNVWCRMFCPTGGVLEGLSRFAVFRVYKNDICNDCDNCRQLCAMKTRPAETNCTNCGDCVSQCPQHAVKIGRKGK